MPSLKKDKIRKKQYTDEWYTNMEQLSRIREGAKKYKYYVNEKCIATDTTNGAPSSGNNITYGMKYAPKLEDLSSIKVYGIKHVDASESGQVFWPERKHYGPFDDFQFDQFLLKMNIWYGMWLDGKIINSLVYTPAYVDGVFKIICNIGASRMIFKYAVGDMIPFDEKLRYPAYYYDYSNANFEDIEKILGKGNLEETPDVLPNIDYQTHHLNKNKKLVPMVNSPNYDTSFIESVRKQMKPFWNHFDKSEYELHFYKNNELQFSMNMNKKPLRINIDHERLPQWIGMCQATLWFFFGVDTWPDDKKYFSVG